MKLKQTSAAVLAALILSGCVNTPRVSEDGSKAQVEQEVQQYRDITAQYKINEAWWKGYQDAQLNRLIDTALRNNVDLKKSAIAINKALYQANLLGANLVPSFSGSGSANASRVIGEAATGTTTKSFGTTVSMSYTIDLWKRLADSASAAEWEYKATQDDLNNTRLTLINSLIDAYYNYAYYDNAIRITEQMISNYQRISKIMGNKFRAGATDQLSVQQANQSVLSAQNSLISLRSSRKTTEQTLRNLLNLRPQENFTIIAPSLINVKAQGVNLNVPVSAIANRPDVRAVEHRFQSSFKSLTAMEKSWYPTVTLGASLGGSGTSLKTAGQNLAASGLINFDLPFLNYNTVKWNVKTSEADYELAKLNFEQTVTKALNEIDNYYYAYQQSQAGLGNLQQQLATTQKISQYYKNRYNAGASELREWLSALNNQHSAQMSLLNAKYSVLRGENLVYQAMAGKYQP